MTPNAGQAPYCHSLFGICCCTPVVTAACSCTSSHLVTPTLPPSEHPRYRCTHTARSLRTALCSEACAITKTTIVRSSGIHIEPRVVPERCSHLDIATLHPGYHHLTSCRLPPQVEHVTSSAGTATYSLISVSENTSPHPPPGCTNLKKSHLLISPSSYFYRKTLLGGFHRPTSSPITCHLANLTIVPTHNELSTSMSSTS